jgi:hypothetical protein
MADDDKDRCRQVTTNASVKKRRRALDAAALVSAALLLSTIALWLATFAVNPWEHHLSLTDSFHVGLWGGVDGPTFGRLVFFNDGEYGPYRGSIVWLTDAQGNSHSEDRLTGWGDSFGVYYRHFCLADTGRTLWTLMISLLYPFGLFAILPLAWGWWRWRSAFCLRHVGGHEAE